MYNAKDIFADNVDALTTGVAIKPIVEEAQANGEDIDYSYITRVKNKKINPSLQKTEQIVRIFKSLPGCENIHLWMFLVPNFFKEKKHLQTSQNIGAEFSALKFTKELLFAIRTMRIMDISEKQYNDIINIAEYLSKKSESSDAENFEDRKESKSM